MCYKHHIKQHIFAENVQQNWKMKSILISIFLLGIIVITFNYKAGICNCMQMH